MLPAKAIFFDIDGTLFSLKTHSIPASAKQAIRLLRAKGIKAIIATGRSFRDIDNLEDLEFDGFITANGTCCLDCSGEIFAQQLISRDSLGKLAAYLDEKPFSCAFMTNSGNFINYADDGLIALGKLVNVPTPPVKDVAEIIELEVFQMSAFVDLKREAELLRLLTDCNSSRWHPDFTDFNARNCDKASGIDRFLDYFGIGLEHTMAFGDGGNDISMLKHAAIGIAMGNGADEVKAAADYVADAVEEDGIYNALRRFGVI